MKLLEKIHHKFKLRNENLESFNADGNFEIVNKETILDLKLKFDKFNIATLTPRW
jgi:hypothetical protein